MLEVDLGAADADQAVVAAVAQSPLTPGEHHRLGAVRARTLHRHHTANHHRQMAVRARLRVGEQTSDLLRLVGEQKPPSLVGSEQMVSVGEQSRHHL